MIFLPYAVIYIATIGNVYAIAVALTVSVYGPVVDTTVEVLLLHYTHSILQFWDKLLEFRHQFHAFTGLTEKRFFGNYDLWHFCLGYCLDMFRKVLCGWSKIRRGNSSLGYQFFYLIIVINAIVFVSFPDGLFVLILDIYTLFTNIDAFFTRSCIDILVYAVFLPVSHSLKH